MKKGFVAAAACAVGLVACADLPNWTVAWNEDASEGEASNDQNTIVLRVTRTSSHGGFGLRVGTATGNGVVSIDTPAYLDMRGPITGPDPSADPVTNAVWKFSHLRSQCFRANNGSGVGTPARDLTGLHTPGTLVSDGWSDVFHIDGSPNGCLVTEIIVDEPDFTENIGSWGLSSVSKLAHLVFRVPKAQSLTSPVSHSATGWSADVGKEWDFSGIKYVGSTGSATSKPSWGPFHECAFGKMTGILRLPSLVHIAATEGNGRAFAGCGISGAELGIDGALVHLADYSFSSCDKLTDVIIGAAPSGKAQTICAGAFRCNNLKTVYFNGEKPTFSGEGVAFGTSAPEGYMTFYVRDTPSWAGVLAEADANGGLVSAATLHTANPQRVERYSGFNKMTVELQDPRFADIYHEKVTLTAPGMREDGYILGEVTIEATCSEPDDAETDPRRARFLRWDGVPVELERQNPLTYTPRNSGVVRAVFAHDWLMSDTAEPGRTMDNRFWRICCWKRDASQGWVGLGKASDKVGKGSMWPDAADRKGGGDLNLNGDIWDSEGKKWSLVSCAGMAVWTVDGKFPSTTTLAQNGELDLLPTRLTLPETLLWWPGEIQNYDSWDNGANVPHWPIKEVVAICPKATGTVSSFTVGGCSDLSRLVIRAPKLTKFGDGRQYGFTWTATQFTKTSFDEWDLTGVTTISDNAFQGATEYQITGTLHLPNVTTIGTNAFYRLIKVTGMVLGTNKLSLASVGDTAFTRTTKLETLAIGTRGLKLGNSLGAGSVFTGLSGLKSIHIPGRMIPTDQVDALLTAVAESDGAKKVTIYASPYCHWDRVAAKLTDEEQAICPDACFGVYREGSRKAWFVTERSGFEPRGGLVILR